jgi:hypothetical protein
MNKYNELIYTFRPINETRYHSDKQLNNIIQIAARSLKAGIVSSEETSVTR